MNRTEIVVRTLLAGLAGEVEISPLETFGEHKYNDAQIGDLHISFWARMEIRRVARVEFPDGSVIDYEKEETVPDPWVPPREEFPDWWRVMGTDEALSEEVLREQNSQLVEASRDAKRQGRKEEADELWSRYVEMFDRPKLYNPLFYLTEDQQDELEGRLRG